MSKAVIKSNLDDETLNNAITKGGFEAYPERDHEDGYHTYPNEEESVDLEVEVTDVEISDDSDEIARDAGEEVAYKNKVTKTIRKTGEEVGPDDISAEGVKKIKKMKKQKKGFTVEDVIARSLDDLCCEHHEYYKDDNEKRHLKKKTWFKIGKNAIMMGFTLSNALVGAGILSFSQSCLKMGIFGFTAWSLATIVFFVVTWNYWNRAIYITGAATMGELLSLIFGKVFAAIVDVCNTGFYFCVMMCYQVIATQYIFGIICDLTDDSKFNYSLKSCYGDSAAGIFCQWHYILLYIVAICFNLPLILPKSVKFLNKISTLTVISAIVATAVVMIKAIIAAAQGVSSNGAGDENHPTFDGKWWPQGFMEFFTMAPFITANFQIHSALPPLYVGTKNLSKKVKLSALQGGSYVSIVVCSLLFLCMAVSGCVSFDKVSSNVLNDFSSPTGEPDYAIIVCRILMTIVVIISYPALMFPTSAGILRYIPKSSKVYQLWNGRFIILVIRIVFLIGTTLVSTFVTDIGVIFSVASALFSIVVVYIGPMSIMMLWPRIEKLGNPDYRKLSVIDNLLYNKVVDGNQYFTPEDVRKKVKAESVTDVVVEIQTHENGHEDIELKEIKQTQTIAVKSDSSHDSSSSDNSDSDKENKKNEDEDEESNIYPHVQNELMKYKNQWIKLPPAKISPLRYILYFFAMGCCTALCVLSIIGTIAEQF